MTGEINMKVLLERVENMTNLADELEKMAITLRNQTNLIYRIVNDIKPTKVEDGIGWIEAK